MNIKNDLENRSQLEGEILDSKHEKNSQSKGSQNESEMEFFKNENSKSKKLKFLNERQKHVLVGLVGAAIIILLSYALLTLLALIKQ